MRTLVIFFALIAFVLPQEALALEVKANESEITYGDEVQLSLRGSGDKMRLVALAFPYETPETVAEWEGQKNNLIVRPSRNTKYKLLKIEGGQITERSRAQMIWVEPRVETAAERNGPFLYVRGSLRFSDYFWKAYKKLPLKQRKIYLYQTCPGSSTWKLESSYSLRSKLFIPNTYLSWQFGATLQCKRGGYQTLGFFFFPSMLQSGDEGLGKPKLSFKEAKKAVSLLGRDTIPSKDMARFFPL